MRPIFLIGFMGSGKSTLGRAAAARLGLRFIDLDNYIEARFHANVRDIFASEGEASFRDKEQRMLHEVADFEDTLVACGGGTPCHADNMHYMNSRGTTVWLDAGIPRTYARLLKGRYKRPAIAGLDDDELLEFIKRTTVQRRQHYIMAHHTFPSHRLDTMPEIQESVEQFAQMLNLPIQQ